MRRLTITVLVAFFGIFQFAGILRAQTRILDTGDVETATASSTIIEIPTATPAPRQDLTQESEETVEPLKKLLDSQSLGSVWPFNPLKYAIRHTVDAKVPPNTIVLLLLLPGVAALIAGARHLIGLRGFGIFLPAALAVTFVATGPIVGIVLFMESPNVPVYLREAEDEGLPFRPAETVYVLGFDHIVVSRPGGMERWRKRLFALMQRNEQVAAQHFGLPPAKVVEVGEQLDI